jgi:hypothetical protein
MRTSAPTFAYLLSNEWDGEELAAPGYWKIPLMGDGGEITGAHISRQQKRKLTGPVGKWNHMLWKYGYEPFSPLRIDAGH